MSGMRKDGDLFTAGSSEADGGLDKKRGGGGKQQAYDTETGQYGINRISKNEETVQKRSGAVAKRRTIQLSKQEYAAVCSAIRTKYADKIPCNGALLHGDHYYEYRYGKDQEKIICTCKIGIEGNEWLINSLMRGDLK